MIPYWTSVIYSMMENNKCILHPIIICVIFFIPNTITINVKSCVFVMNPHKGFSAQLTLHAKASGQGDIIWNIWRLGTSLLHCWILVFAMKGKTKREGRMVVLDQCPAISELQYVLLFIRYEESKMYSSCSKGLIFPREKKYWTFG